MAVIALEKLEDQLSCSICLDTYTNPKQLLCHHVYCQQCLVKLVVRDQQGQLALTCPNCRQITPVPASGVAGLQSAFQINQLLEIMEKHKKPAVATERLKNVPDSLTVRCPNHDGREVELYCETCEETICFKCIMKDEKHHSHHYEELNKAFERYAGEITLALEPLEKQLVIVEKTLAQVDGSSNEISDQQVAIEEDIHKKIVQLHETLDVRKTELIDRLDQLTQAKLKSLAAQREQLETTQGQLSSCLHFLKESLKSGNKAGEMLMMKSNTVEQVKELTATFPQADMLEPNTAADMAFVTSADLNTECRTYGQILEVGPPDPSKCCTMGNGMEIAIVGEKSTVFVQTVDFYKRPCKVAKGSLTCELVSERTGARVSGKIERRIRYNHHEISYQPTIKGKHRLHIKVKDQHIRGSPFPVSVTSSVEKLGIPILTICGENGPIGTAVNHMGEVIVSEWDGHCITVFSSRGEKLRSFGGYGYFEGYFRNPHGVAVDNLGNIFVADCNNLRIQKFTSQGNLLAIAVMGIFQFPYSRGIAFNASNSKVYVSCGNGCIQVFDSNLNYCATFGEKGSGNGQLDTPRHIACDRSGNVYVADSGNHRIQVFTAEGDFFKMLGSGGCGGGRGELCMPFGVTIDTSDRIYISEKMNHRVSVFTLEGQFVTSFGIEGDGPGEFKEPAGLALDSSGVVYVCDSSNRIQLF